MGPSFLEIFLFEAKLSCRRDRDRKSSVFKEAGIVYFNSWILKKAILSSIFSMGHNIDELGTDHHCRVSYGGKKLHDMTKIK